MSYKLTNMTNNSSLAKLIEANAGSGKTYALTLEYINLLLQGETVDHILATTFTKKAASEIASRVIKRLAEAVLNKEKEEDIKKDLNLNTLKISPSAALSNLIKYQHKMMISTMDSFFAKIATTFSTELGFNSKINISTEDIKNSIICEAIRNLCNDEKEDEVYKFFKELSNNLIMKSINKDLDKYFKVIYDESKSLNKDNLLILKCEHKIPSKNEIKTFIEKVINLELPKNKNGSDNKYYIDLKSSMINDLKNENWSTITASAFYKNIINGTNKFHGADIPQEYQDIGNYIINIYDAYTVNILNNKILALYNLIFKFSKYYEDIRNRMGVLDFSELKYALSKIATTDNLEEIYYRLDTSFRHILLDEFQDTSLEEWKIIEPIVSEILSSLERSFFCVGDPKQAIYAWRGGVSQIFKKISTRWPHVKKIELVKSYRSSQVIIDFVNSIFKNFDKIKFEGKYKTLALSFQENFPLHAVNDKTLKGHVLFKLIGDEENKENVDSSDNEKSPSIEELIIKETCQRAKELTLKYPNLSIAILCRDNKVVKRIIYALDEAPYNIKASQEGKTELLEFRSIIFILSVFKYLAHSADTMSLFKIKSVLDDLDLEVNSVLKEAQNLLLMDGFKGVTFYLYEIIKDSLTTLEIKAIKELIDTSILYDKGRNKSIDDFINKVSLQKMINITKSNVRVMTIHSAKGLEFDAVILPDLDGDIFAHPNPIIHYYEDLTKEPSKVYVNAPKAVSEMLEIKYEDFRTMQLQERNRTLEESFCLLYVALTRAKESLTIFASKKIKEKFSKQDFVYTMSSFLMQALAKDNDILDVYESGDKDFHNKKSKLSNVTKNIDNQDLTFTSFKKKDKVKNLTVKSPSNEEGDDKLQIKDILNIDLAHTLKRGTLYHKFFEQIDWIENLKLDKDNFLLNSAYLDVLMDFENSELEKLFLKFKNSLSFENIKLRLSKSYYKKLWNLDKFSLLKEEPFMFRKNNVIYKGFIDRVVLGYKEDKLKYVNIIDFKSDVVKKEELQNRASFYEPQLNIYKEALVNRYGNGVNISSTLLFVLMGEVIDL